MTTDIFDNPGSAAGFTWEDHDGALLLIKPLSVESGIKTTFGDKDAVRADITVLDGDHAGQEYADTLIFPLVIQGQVRANAGSGRMNLGRLGKGVARPGQKPPWKLEDPTDQDKTIARAHLQKNAPVPF